MQDITTDVVVVGGGGTGLAAAIEAAQAGARTLLIEKNPTLGGTTGWSVGSITSSATAEQRAVGITDTPQEHFDDMPRFHGRHAGRDNEALRRLLVENTPDTMRWLRELGLVFVDPMPEPPHQKPRLHNVLPNSRAFVFHLERRARALGVEIRCATAAVRLLRDGGRVGGVEATGPGGALRATARRGVVLAAGDYSASRDLKAQLVSDAVAAVEPFNPASTGDGHRMALEAGARILNGDIVWGPEIRFVPPTARPWVQRLPPSTLLARMMRIGMKVAPPALLRPFLMSFLTTALAPSANLFAKGAIMVNARGERFAEELDAPAPALARQPDGVGYIILDATVARQFGAWPNFISTAPGVAYAYLDDYRRNRRDVFREAPTLDALASSLGIEPARLRQTVETHNAALSSGAGRATSNQPPRPPIATAPFIALGPARSYIMFTDGGLAVSERLEVLDGAGQPIPGLFAGGSTGQGGLLLEGHGHHLGWAFTSGRIAGRNAAASAPA
ncbi:MAG: FAD-dependent oxidoreductase [Alphaproteobacteria bacterium]|nr:FAD-dependent oxidoreductase [Alphaproteobacteria bacterium]